MTLTLLLAPLMMLLLWWILEQGIPRELPVAVYDADHSALSRQLIRSVDASPTLQVVTHVNSSSEGIKQLQNAEVYALISLPADFENDVRRLGKPQLTTFFNAQYLLAAKAVRSALYEIEMRFAYETRVASILPRLPNVEAAMAKAVPARSQITPLFNSNLNYAPFLLPGLFAALIQASACLGAVLVLGRGLKYGFHNDWSGAKVSTQLAGRLLPYFIWHVMVIITALIMGFGIGGWPFQDGSAMLLIPAALLVLSSQALGALFVALGRQLERSLSLAGAFCAPAFAFLGVTFPTSDMSPFAQFWRSLMPAAHFLDAYTQQTQYAAGLAGIFLPVLALMAYLLIWPLVKPYFTQAIRSDKTGVSGTA